MATTAARSHAAAQRRAACTAQQQRAAHLEDADDELLRDGRELNVEVHLRRRGVEGGRLDGVADGGGDVLQTEATRLCGAGRAVSRCTVAT